MQVSQVFPFLLPQAQPAETESADVSNANLCETAKFNGFGAT